MPFHRGNSTQQVGVRRVLDDYSGIFHPAGQLMGLGWKGRGSPRLWDRTVLAITESMDSSTNKPNSFIDLFLKAEPRVYAYIRSQIPHRSDAEDVLQETAGTLWSKFGEYTPGSNFLAWAYQVARFKVQHYHEKQTRQRRLFSHGLVELVAARAEGMASELSELEPMLAECMQRLSDADREVVQRCYGSEATVAMVADELGRSVNTIKSVLKRARLALFECIQRALQRETRR